MSLYPSLEDMKVDQMMKAQIAHESQGHVATAGHNVVPDTPPPYPINPQSIHIPAEKYSNLYPELDDYMGLQLQHYVAPATSVVPAYPSQVAIPSPRSTQMVAPISGSSLGLARAQVNHGIREVLLCKDQNGKVGLRVQAINKGIFIIVVQKNTPAALAGLRFGDQILMINDVTLAGYSWEKVHGLIRKANPQRITMVIRDRPFERVVTVHQDSLGNVGFGHKDGKIVNIVKDSSAARNGLLIDHHLLEVNGQNVVGLRSSEITGIIKNGGKTITLTIMPSFVYDHLIKSTASSFLKKTMDHSIPDI